MILCQGNEKYTAVQSMNYTKKLFRLTLKPPRLSNLYKCSVTK